MVYIVASTKVKRKDCLLVKKFATIFYSNETENSFLFSTHCTNLGFISNSALL